MHTQCLNQKQDSDTSSRHIDAIVRLNMVLQEIFPQGIKHFLFSPKKGEVMSQSTIRAKICAGKINIDSSIQVQHPGDFMRLRRPVGPFNTELLGVLRVQPLPAAKLHRLATNDAADGSSAEKVIQNIETNVPPGSTHRDEEAIDVVPQRQARAATNGFEFPPDILVAPVVVRHLG